MEAVQHMLLVDLLTQIKESSLLITTAVAAMILEWLLVMWCHQMTIYNSGVAITLS